MRKFVLISAMTIANLQILSSLQISPANAQSTQIYQNLIRINNQMKKTCFAQKYNATENRTAYYQGWNHGFQGQPNNNRYSLTNARDYRSFCYNTGYNSGKILYDMNEITKRWIEM